MSSLRLLDSPNYSMSLKELKYSFSIIVPVNQKTPAFEACLESLVMLEPQPHEVIIVANGDQGAAASWARQIRPTSRSFCFPKTEDFLMIGGLCKQMPILN